MGKATYFPCGNACLGWESDGRKVLILWGKYGYQFCSSPNLMHFTAFSYIMRN